MAQPDYTTHPQTLPQPDVVVTVNIQLMVAAVVFLFMVVVFIFFLYIYVKHYMRTISRSRRRIIFTTDQPPLASETRGLDSEILTSLPITIYKSSDHKEVTECTVCLTELSEGEKVRILPKCNHGFHVECIDMWFHSHSTCPICRASITKDVVEVTGSSSFPTNVLFWGNGNEEGSSLSSLSLKRGNEGMLVIDIPRRGSIVEDINGSPLPVSKSPMDEVRTPSSGRLRSLRRLLSRGKMVIGSYSPRGGGDDLERGVVGEASGTTPKTPLS